MPPGSRRFSRARSLAALRLAGWAPVILVVFLPGLWLIADALRDLPSSADAMSLGRTAGLLARSLALAILATAIAAALGVAGAVFIETARLPGKLRAALRLAALAGVFLPPYYQVAVWRQALGELPRLGAERGLAIAVAIFGIAYAPLVMFFAAHGLRSIPRDLIDAARLSGAPWWRAVTGVLLPLAAPPILAGIALVLVMTLLNYEVPALLSLPVYPVEILLEYQSRPRSGAAMALAAPFLVLALAALAALSRLFARGFRIRAAEAPGEAAALTSGWPGAAAGLLLAGLWVLWPLGKLAAMAGGPALPSTIASVLDLHGGELLAGILTSLAAAAAAVALAALVLPRRGRPRAGLLVWLPLALPGPLLGAALIRIYNRPALGWIYDGPLILAVAAAARFFPIAYHALAAHLRSVPEELWEAADLSPAGRLEKFIHVYLPLAGPGLALAAAAFLLFQSAELSAAVLVAPAGLHPVPLTIYDLLHYNTALETPAALCLCHLAAVLAIIGTLQVLGRWPLRRAGGGERSRA